MVKKLKEKFGEVARDATKEDDEEDEEEEEEQAQEPLTLTQGMGEDLEEEGAKEEKSNGAPEKAEPKKRKAKAQPIA